MSTSDRDGNQMANLEELERLAELKDKGFLTAEEFEKQKAELLARQDTATASAPKRKRSWKVPLIILAVGVLSLPYFIRGGIAGLPACDSSDTKSALKNAIEDSPSSNLVNIKFLDLREVTEISYQADKNERNCRGKFVLNSGEEILTYRVFMTEPNASEFFVEIR
jgi:cytochrome c-type biogenesis protein CcmH/NrfG